MKQFVCWPIKQSKVCCHENDPDKDKYRGQQHPALRRDSRSSVSGNCRCCQQQPGHADVSVNKYRRSGRAKSASLLVEIIDLNDISSNRGRQEEVEIHSQIIKSQSSGKAHPDVERLQQKVPAIGTDRLNHKIDDDCYDHVRNIDLFQVGPQIAYSHDSGEYVNQNADAEDEL